MKPRNVLFGCLTTFVLLSSRSLNEPRFNCNFNGKKISGSILQSQKSASEKYVNLVKNMFKSCGVPNLVYNLYSTTSNDLDYACCGYDQNNSLSIVIREEKLDSLSLLETQSILAHEIGHCFNSDPNKLKIGSEEELNADYYNGFWHSKNKFKESDLNEIYSVYSLVAESDVHPEKEIRIKKVYEGFIDGTKTFSYNPNLQLDKVVPKLKSTKDAEKYLSFLISIDPNYHIENKTKKFNVYLNIIARDINADENSILNQIDHVEYVLHSTFRRRISPSYESKNNFQKKLEVWGSFPIIAIIYLKNDKVISLTSDFILP